MSLHLKTSSICYVRPKYKGVPYHKSDRHISSKLFSAKALEIFNLIFLDCFFVDTYLGACYIKRFIAVISTILQ